MELDLGSELLASALVGDEEYQNIIKEGVDINFRNRYGQTALFFSNATRILINAGAHVDIKDNMGKTPLFLSDSEKSKILIEYGANVNSKNRRGDTPIFIADRKKMKVLIEAGADVNSKNNLGQTPLFYSYGTSDILIKNKALINIQDCHGKSALFYSNHYKTELLVEHGANIYIKDHYGKTALDHSKHYGKTKFLIRVISADKIVRYIRMFLSFKKVNYLRILPENLFKDEFRYTRMKILGISDFWSGMVK